MGLLVFPAPSKSLCKCFHSPSAMSIPISVVSRYSVMWDSWVDIAHNMIPSLLSGQFTILNMFTLSPDWMLLESSNCPLPLIPILNTIKMTWRRRLWLNVVNRGKVQKPGLQEWTLLQSVTLVPHPGVAWAVTVPCAKLSDPTPMHTAAIPPCKTQPNL